MISYSHVISVDGWYKSATIGLNASMAMIKDWANYGLGRHIETYSHTMSTIWEGVVNEIVIEMGDVSYTIGPLLEIENDGKIKYNEVTTQIASETFPLPDIDSIERYGTRSAIISEGNISDEIADAILATRTRELKDPKKKRASSLGKGNMLSITLNCIGYGDLVNYPYLNATDEEIDASAKLLDVFSNAPDNILVVDPGEIEYNDKPVPALEDKDRLAGAIVSEIVNYGNFFDERMIWGVGPGRVPFYRTITPNTEVDYHARIFSDSISVREQPYPWLVTPDHWVVYDDMAALFEPDYDASNSDPGKEYIESVTFTAPFGLDFNEGYTGIMSQQLASLGLFGE